MVAIAAAPLAARFAAGAAGATALRQASRQPFEYDFAGLVVKLIIFYSIAYVTAKVFEAIIFGNVFLNTLLGLGGIHVPNTLPEPLRKLFAEGYDVGGINLKWWDFIKILSILLVTFEAFRYDQNNKTAGKQNSPLALGIFTVIIAGLSLITFPELIQMAKEMRMVIQQ